MTETEGAAGDRTGRATTMHAVTSRLMRARDTARAGLGVSSEDLLVAALVAAPFAGTFGIALSALTWWPNPVVWVATALIQGAATLWIAGHRRAGESE